VIEIGLKFNFPCELVLHHIRFYYIFLNFFHCKQHPCLLVSAGVNFAEFTITFTFTNLEIGNTKYSEINVACLFKTKLSC
jgi:hypothetical protein